MILSIFDSFYYLEYAHFEKDKKKTHLLSPPNVFFFFSIKNIIDCILILFKPYPLKTLVWAKPNF